MPAIAQVGISTAGGGVITGPGAPTVKANGSIVAVLGDAVASHGSGVHANATIITASSTVKAEGKFVARVGDLASCGHAIVGGSSNVNAG
jgi:uncharacterized Zn-binding protein involved in type VI secretion